MTLVFVFAGCCSLREEQERRIKELAAAWREEIVRTAAEYEGRIGELERRLRFEVHSTQLPSYSHCTQKSPSIECAKESFACSPTGAEPNLSVH